MRKLGLFLIPLITIPFLASCGGDKPGPESTHTLIINFTNCTIEGSSSPYVKEYANGEKIEAVTVTPDDDFALNEECIGEEYKSYWEESSTTAGSYVLSGLTMNKDHTIDIAAKNIFTLTINLTNCMIGEETTQYKRDYIDGEMIENVIVTPTDGYILDDDSIDESYKSYWEESSTTAGSYVLSGLVMDDDYTISINAPEKCVLTINLTSCTIEGKSTKYTHEYAKNKTIEDVIVTPADGYILNDDSIDEDYKSYWKKSSTTAGSYVLSGLVMDDNHTISINAPEKCTLTFTLHNCHIEGEYTKDYAKGSKIQEITISPNSNYALADNSVASTYAANWKPSTENIGSFILYDLVMDKDYDVTVAAYEGYSITSEIAGVTILPSTAAKNKDYTGLVTVVTEGMVLPESLDSVVLEDTNAEITDYEYTLQLGRKTAIITIPADSVTNNIKVSLTLVDETNMWFKKSEWWKYCSNGETNQQALETDVGQEVEFTLTNGNIQKVRLIDTDYDIVTSSNIEAHCTFECSEVINGFETSWDYEKNYNFINSKLNGYLKIKGTIYNLIPSNLINEIKVVNKYVEVSTDSGATYTPTLFTQKLFPLSVDEINGTDETNNYEYYKGANNDKRIKSNKPYWLRTPSFTIPANTGARGINAYGSVGNTSIFNDSNYIAPAFCI